MDRMDALIVRENNGKSYFTKIGSLWQSKDGKGFTATLDAIPAAIDGQYRILFRPPLPKDGQRPSPSNLDDDVPF